MAVFDGFYKCDYICKMLKFIFFALVYTSVNQQRC